MAIKNAKYRVKNSEGTYDVVHFETGVAQVQGLNQELDAKADESTVDQRFQEANGFANGLNTRLSAVETGLSNEVANRESEITRVEDLVSGVASDLADEVARAELAEQALDERVGVLEGLVGDGLDGIQSDISDLQSGLAQEVIDREAAIVGVQDVVATKASKADLNAEIDRAQTEEVRLGNLVKQVQDEIDDLEVVVGDNKTAIEGTVSTLEGKVEEYQTSNVNAIAGLEGRLNIVEPKVSTLIDELDAVELDIENLKLLVEGKNSNTMVFSTMDEFTGAALSPKIGDLVFVIESKKAYIYKGEMVVATLETPMPPAGWVLFDDISTEVDLVAYAKKAEVEAADQALQIAIDEVEAKVDAEVIRATEAEAGLQAAINGEVSDRIAAVKVVDDAVKALDSKVNNAAQVVGTETPSVSAPVGHVWIEILG